MQERLSGYCLDIYKTNTEPYTKRSPCLSRTDLLYYPCVFRARQNRLSKCDYSLATKTDFRAQQPEGTRQVPLLIVAAAWDQGLVSSTPSAPVQDLKES